MVYDVTSSIGTLKLAGFNYSLLEKKRETAKTVASFKDEKMANLVKKLLNNNRYR